MEIVDVTTRKIKFELAEEQEAVMMFNEFIDLGWIKPERISVSEDGSEFTHKSSCKIKKEEGYISGFFVYVIKKHNSVS